MSATNVLADANIRSRNYYVARATAECPGCGLHTRLLALALPHLHETLDPEDDWERVDASAFLFYVEQLPDAVRHRLEPLSRHYRPAQSAATQTTYWANHCEHCGSMLDDHEQHCEPDGAFFPTSEAAAANVELLRISEPFEAAAAGYALEPEFFSFMRRS
jgi:hypothetical protein